MNYKKRSQSEMLQVNFVMGMVVAGFESDVNQMELSRREEFRGRIEELRELEGEMVRLEAMTTAAWTPSVILRLRLDLGLILRELSSDVEYVRPKRQDVFYGRVAALRLVDEELGRMQSAGRQAGKVLKQAA